MINGFNKFGTGVTVVITVFTAIAVFEYQTGIKFPLLNKMVEPDAAGVIPLESGLLVCGQIAIVLIKEHCTAFILSDFKIGRAHV